MEEKVIWNSSADNNYNEEEVMLPGFRFHPTDEELVGFYLRRKVEKKPVSFELIKQIDLYKYDPWDLPKISDVGEKEWYFFCVRGRKYRNSIRPNRVTGSGFWKATGIDKPIYSNLESNQCIGLKKSLVYYRGSAGKGTKTDWMMHEFRLPPSSKNIDHPNPNNIISQEAEVWTLCRIFRRNASCKKYIPEWKYSSGTQTATDERSETCSIMSENNEQYISHRDLIAEENRRMSTPAAFNPMEKRNQPFTGDHNSTPYEEDPFTKSYPCLWKPNNDELLGVGKWDELRSVVDLGIDPSSVYGYI